MEYVAVFCAITALADGFSPLVRPGLLARPRCVPFKKSALADTQLIFVQSLFMSKPKDLFEGFQSNVDEDFDPDDEVPDEIMADVDSSQPSRWMVAKELLGINVFTYILAGLIVFFLSMNVVLGPGWLGGVVGVKGTGNIDDVSNSLPGMMDLSSPEYRL